MSISTTLANHSPPHYLSEPQPTSTTKLSWPHARVAASVFSVDGVFLHVLGAKLGASAVLFKAPYGVAVAAGRLIVSENTEGRCSHGREQMSK